MNTVLCFLFNYRPISISFCQCLYFCYTGQQDDARMNLAIALTAARHGATITNHVSVVKLHKTDGKLSGARVRVCYDVTII